MWFYTNLFNSIFGLRIAPLVGAAIASGGLSFLGDILGANATASAQQSANEANLFALGKQHAFQKEMSNTAYQRATTDMKLAGINPMLAYMQGGASTPQGGSVDIKPVVNDGIGRGLKSVANTAMNAMTTQAELKNKEADSQLKAAAALTEVEKAKASGATAQEARLRTKHLETTLPATAEKSKYEAEQAKWDTKMQSYDNLTKRLQMLMNVGHTAFDMLDMGMGKDFPKVPKDFKEAMEWMKKNRRKPIP